MTDQTYAAIDLEMTGLKPGLDEIIEVGIVRCSPDEVLERWSTLVRPLEMPNLRVQRLTGITPEMLEGAPSWSEVETRVRELLDGAVLIGHNVGFDISFLEAAGVEVSQGSVDTLPLSQIVDPMAPSHRLGDLCERYGVELDDAHRALSDAEASRRVLLEVRERYGRLPQSARDALGEIAQGQMFWPPSLLLREWSLEMPTASEQPVRPRAPEYPPLEPEPLPAGSLAELTEQAFASAAGDGFERREEQLAMARNVAEALQHGGTLIVEAGTGTGKSLAYLMPASLWALKTGNTVVVSTHTLNLQQQLEQHDVEFARRLIAGVSEQAAAALRSTVIKGRDHYLCQEHVDSELRRVGEWEDPMVLARAAVWRSQSERGDRGELRLPLPMLQRWERLSASNTNCLNDRSCQYAMDGTCFLLRAQRRAAGSHIVIANHALLVRSLETGVVTMPESAVVIIDEAHALEDVATDQLTLQMSDSWAMEPVRRAVDGPSSLVASGRRVGLRKETSQLERVAEASQGELERLFDALAEFATAHSSDQRGSDDWVRLSQGARNAKDWSAVEELWESAQGTLSPIAAQVEEVAAALSSKAEQEQGDRAHELRQLEFTARNLADDLRGRSKSLGRALTEFSQEMVDWVSRENRRSGAASVHAAPLSVADALRPLWSERHASVLTGATLAASAEAGSSFAYLRERLGISDADEAQYGSPFDYEERCRVFLPTDGLDASDSEFDEYAAQAVAALASAAGGRTMVLFRSYSAMNRVARQVEPVLAQADLVLLCQGRDGSPERIIETLREDSRSVAFGVSAMWTGVDVAGDALSQLIITRLPFDPPNDPVRKARGEQYENEFMEYALPTAVLQFRQGAGRLIRTQTDRGVLVVLDGRVTSRRYGSHFRDALPPAPQRELPTASIAGEVAAFLAGDVASA